MLYNDLLYGELEINEPVILELINGPALQRLKDIDQAGYRPMWLKPEIEASPEETSRFAHSLGVYLLLRRYGAPLAEQAAGLIHDVSHGVFSHCLDYVLASGAEAEQSHQDDIFADFVSRSEIPAVLKKHGFDPAYILNDRNFPLKETELPDLCADRLDYSLRTALIFGELDEKTKEYLLDNLSVENGRWFFKGFAAAKKFAALFFKLNSVYYSGLSTAVMFRTVGDCLRHALQKGYLSESDLYTTDRQVLATIKEHLAQDERLRLLWERMNGRVKVTNNPVDYDCRVICKSRVVDPWCRHQGGLKRLSELEPGWREILEKESKPKEYFLKFAGIV